MLVNLQSIIVDKPIPGLTGVAYNKCTTLADVLAALAGQGGTDVHAVSGSYNPATENIVIQLSNGGSFSIPASLLLPVVADGTTITGNGTNANKLVGYQVAYNATTGELTITPPNGTPVVVPAQTATEEKAADPHNLLGLGVGATVTTQQMLDYLATKAIKNLTTNGGSKATLTNGDLNIPNPAPVASFTRTSKMGLTAAYSAAASSGTQAGNNLTYAWTVAPRSGTTGTGTPATPTAINTAVTFSAPGQYDITLTVTDGNGATDSETQTITVARVLEVASPTESNNDYLATVTAALAWKNANDSTNTYQILVRGNTTEPASIVNADRAHIHYEAGANSSFSANGYSWTTTPADARLTADRSNPYRPAVTAVGTALNLDGVDATNLHIESIGLLSLGGRALMSNNMSNLRLHDVGTRAAGTDPYVHAHVGGENVTVSDCYSVGVGMAYALIAAQNRFNTMRLINSYGEVVSTPATFTLGVLYTPGSIWVGTTQDLLVAQNTLINNAPGNNGSGVPRSVVVNGGSVTAVVTGARFVDNTLIQNVAGNPVMRTQSVDASRNVIPMLGNQMLGGVAFSNCASAVVTTTNSNDIL
jgi:hypothetical protein